MSTEKLKLLLQAFKKTTPKTKGENEDDEEEDLDVPYLFFINGHEIQSTIAECLKHQIINTEKTVPIIYQPQAIFKYIFCQIKECHSLIKVLKYLALVIAFFCEMTHLHI